MNATIHLATENKLNCFISARGMLTNTWHCALVLLFLWVFFVDFYMLINHLLKKMPNLTMHLVIGAGRMMATIQIAAAIFNVLFFVQRGATSIGLQMVMYLNNQNQNQKLYSI